MAKDIQVIDKQNGRGRPIFDFTQKILYQIKELASYLFSKQEIGRIIG